MKISPKNLNCQNILNSQNIQKSQKSQNIQNCVCVCTIYSLIGFESCVLGFESKGLKVESKIKGLKAVQYRV